ncbi:hypothetical protein JVT61DRAFT_2544 [Boletus reticuloceps]|uniref:Uncharacterized protein n=1 Tax=Boletus reticuloceps TaxID=495285 RepID=A0A8I3AAT2_9AGAM|nr:hypothetical protein JVT61DRAFT_2544 [Boletus reticuloceps]
MQGDLVDVRRGEYKDLTGYVDSIEANGWLWVKCRLNLMLILVHEDEVRITQPENILSFSKEEGYSAEVKLISEINGGLLKVPVLFCCKVLEYIQPLDFRTLIGRNLWTIGGHKKGLRVTLCAAHRSFLICILSFVTPLNREGMRLDGVRLEGLQLEEFKSMVKRSFVPEPPRARTPSPGPDDLSKETPNDASAWTIGPDDLWPASPLIDKVEWLFDDQFCDFARYRICFNVGVGYRGGAYVKRVMCTTKNPFGTKVHPVPTGHLSLTVTGNHTGSKFEDHCVPARFLTPASPTKKDQVVLILKGDWAGRLCKVIRWMRNEKKAVVISQEGSSSRNDVMVFKAPDICLVVPA